MFRQILSIAGLSIDPSVIYTTTHLHYDVSYHIDLFYMIFSSPL